MDNTTCEDISLGIACIANAYGLLGDDGEPEWMLEFAKRESSRAITKKRKNFEARLAKTKLEEEKQRSAAEHPERPRKKQVCCIFRFMSETAY